MLIVMFNLLFFNKLLHCSFIWGILWAVKNIIVISWWNLWNTCMRDVFAYSYPKKKIGFQIFRSSWKWCISTFSFLLCWHIANASQEALETVRLGCLLISIFEPQLFPGMCRAAGVRSPGSCRVLGMRRRGSNPTHGVSFSSLSEF